MLETEILNVSQFRGFDGHEKVVACRDETTGLRAFISLHNTNLGPGLGGCRFFPYKSENDAIEDVLRLSKGMTYKAALAGLPLGGGKSVIIGNPAVDKTPDLMKSMGEAIQSLQGDYITAEDVGTAEEDMAAIATNTTYVTGLPRTSDDSEIVGGNPSPATAYGVYCGIRGLAGKKYGEQSIAGRSVAVQGLGAVGYALCEYLDKEGAKIYASDINGPRLQQAAASFSDFEAVDNAAIYACEADIFAPCALGATLNSDTIRQMRFDIVAGAANNQLEHPHHDQELAASGILYAPDYVINTGGLICVSYEYFSRNECNPFDYDITTPNMFRHVETIGPTLENILEYAADHDVTPGHAADRLAEKVFLEQECRVNPRSRATP